MQILLHAFYVLLMPTVSYAVMKSNPRSHAAGTSSTQEGWWSFHVFGRHGTAKGTFKQKLDDHGHTQYFGVIEVGDQKLKAVMDTNLFELLVSSAKCTTCGIKTDLYDNSKSKRAAVSLFVASQSFGSGTKYSERARVGRFMVPNQSVWKVYDADMHIDLNSTTVGSPLSRSAKVLEFTTVAQGQSSGIMFETKPVYKNEDEWNAHWADHDPNTEPPTIDFEAEMVVCIYLGTQPPGEGHEVEIKSIEEVGNEVVVKFETSELETTGLAQPHHIVRVARSDKQRFRFEGSET